MNEHKFTYNFLDTINLMCSCGSEPETTAHFLLRCQNHIVSRTKLPKNVYNLDQTLRNYDDDHLIHTLLLLLLLLLTLLLIYCIMTLIFGICSL